MHALPVEVQLSVVLRLGAHVGVIGRCSRGLRALSDEAADSLLLPHLLMDASVWVRSGPGGPCVVAPTRQGPWKRVCVQWEGTVGCRGPRSGRRRAHVMVANREVVVCCDGSKVVRFANPRA